MSLFLNGADVLMLGLTPRADTFWKDLIRTQLLSRPKVLCKGETHTAGQGSGSDHYSAGQFDLDLDPAGTVSSSQAQCRLSVSYAGAHFSVPSEIVFARGLKKISKLNKSK
jgi:hypothetical protein